MIWVLGIALLGVMLRVLDLAGRVHDLEREQSASDTRIAGLSAELQDLHDCIAQGVIAAAPKGDHAQPIPPASGEDEARPEATPA